MHKKFEINRTKIKGNCQSGRKVVTHDSMSDLPLEPDSSVVSLQTADCIFQGEDQGAGRIVHLHTYLK